MTVRLFGPLRPLLFWNIHWRQYKYCKSIYGHFLAWAFWTNTIIKLNQPLHRRTRQPVGGTDGSLRRAKHPWVFLIMIFFSSVTYQILYFKITSLCFLLSFAAGTFCSRWWCIWKDVNISSLSHCLGRFQNQYCKAVEIKKMETNYDW